MRKFNASAHRPYDHLIAEEGMPERYTYQHPAERIAQSVTGVIRLARNIAENTTLPEPVRQQADKIILALFDVPSDAAAMHQALTHYKEDIKSVLESNLRMAQEVTELRGAMMTHAEDASQSAPMPIPLTKEPRTAKAAGE
jgi:hypothetical protein